MISTLILILGAIAFYRLGISWERHRTKHYLRLMIAHGLKNMETKGIYEGVVSLMAFMDRYDD